MSALVYLLVAVLLSLLGTLILWLHQRRPRSMEAGIEEFHRGMQALAPSDRPKRRQSARPGHGGGRADESEAGRGAGHLSGEGRASAG